MADKLLLDTNIVVGLINGESRVVQFLQGRDEIYLPCIALGELFYGAFRSSQVAFNIAGVEAVIAERKFANCDATTARYYGEVKSKLIATGKPIPENDIWIAALAMQHDMTLVSRDSHFGHIASLQTISI